MISTVWQDDEPVNQPWGPTTVVEEPIYQGHHWHTGIDIGSPACAGKPIFAARDGIVTTYTLGVLGITTPDGQTDFYVHGEYSVSWAVEVAKGQRIGIFSNVVPHGGASFGPHLHFEVQPHGGALNVPPGLNPIPVLEGDDMTPAQEAKLNRIDDVIEAIYKGTGPTALPVIAKQLAEIQAKLATSMTGGGLTASQGQALADIHEMLLRIETSLRGA